ncbi:MAG: hypothetical protein AAF517_23640, partial [Planctomycetota bacterium]
MAKRRWRVLYIALITSISLSGTSLLHAGLVADSMLDFTTTGTQGESGWTSGYYNYTTDDDGVYQSENFIPFVNSCGEGGVECADGGLDVAPDGNHWRDNKTWDLSVNPGQPWTFMGAEGVHPSGTNSIRPGD